MKPRITRMLEPAVIFWCALSVLLLACGFTAAGDRPKQPAVGSPRSAAAMPQDAPREKARRLEHVLWDPKTHILEWVVAEGSLDENGKFTPDGQMLIYRIQIDDALMEHKGQWRRFSTKEAVHVHGRLDWLTRYATESTGWWESGQGEPVEGKSKKAKASADYADYTDFAGSKSLQSGLISRLTGRDSRPRNQNTQPQSSGGLTGLAGCALGELRETRREEAQASIGISAAPPVQVQSVRYHDGKARSNLGCSGYFSAKSAKFPARSRPEPGRAADSFRLMFCCATVHPGFETHCEPADSGGGVK